MLPHLITASKIAVPNNEQDLRSFWLGAVGIRDDGTLVSSKNGAMTYSTTVKGYQLNPHSHAEGRLLRKLGKNGIVYVARVARIDGSLVMARPCGMCRTRLKAAHAKKVFYTIDNNHYGVWFPQTNTDKIYEV